MMAPSFRPSKCGRNEGDGHRSKSGMYRICSNRLQQIPRFTAFSCNRLQRKKADATLVIVR